MIDPLCLLLPWLRSIARIAEIFRRLASVCAFITNSFSPINCTVTTIELRDMLKRQIDYKALEMELGEALKADELYKLQNDAKIRAVTQGVPTYDHFREMVFRASL